MRIPGRKIWRAFKELDQFSDEQCARFVKRAWGGWVKRVIASVFVLCVFVATFFGLGSLLVWLHSILGLEDRAKYSDSVIAWMSAVVVLIVGTVAPMTALLARDFMLRAAIWRVLNLGGVCRECQYPLYGLPLSPQFECDCPECGSKTSVDPALVELVRNDAGQAIAAPRYAASTRRTAWTTLRLRLIKRILVALFLIVFVLPIGVLGLNELLVRIEAARASSRRMSTAAIQAIVPSFTDGGPGSALPPSTGMWAIDHDLQMAWSKTANVLGKELVAQNQWAGPGGLDITLLVRPPRRPAPNAPATAQAWYDAQLPLYQRGQEILRRLDAAGSLSRLDDIGSAVPEGGRIVRPRSPQEAVRLMADSLWFSRTIARERLRQFVAAGDQANVERSLRTVLNTLRFDFASPTFQQNYQAVAAEQELYAELREYIVDHPALIEPIERALTTTTPQPNWVNTFRAEKIWFRDYVLSVLSRPAMVRWNRFTPDLVDLLGSSRGLNAMPRGRVGWVGENDDAVSAAYDAVIAQLQAPPYKRPAIPLLRSDLVLVSPMAMPASLILPMVDVGAAGRASMPVVLAIERFRRDRGKLPASLDDPDLNLTAALKLDPLSGATWRYVPAPSGPIISSFNLAGGYMLYSIGPDGTDDLAASVDSGTIVLPERVWGLQTLQGRDILLNTLPTGRR
jgi:hypothetical protein